MKARFEGWYYKHQAKGKSMSIIPGRGADEAFIMAITDSNSYYIKYPLSEYQNKTEVIQVGNSLFSNRGIMLDINHPELVLTGEIKYTDITPINSDIMGPFRFFPMECRHEILSMRHSLSGEVMLNGAGLDFTGGTGYIESDSGRSFPDGYMWLQCNDFDRDISIMAAIAKIPFYGIKFWGCICNLQIENREYRLATYKGVKILKCEPGCIELKQGKYRLAVTVDIQNNGQQLSAPRFGKMNHTIHETLSCPAKFHFRDGDHTLLAEESNGSSYEYEIAAN